MAKKFQSNEAFVKDLMNFSAFGGLSQAFVIEAIMKWSEIIAAEDPKKFESDFMSGAAWVGVAKEISAKCEAKYGPKKEGQK